jgi:hypothetical protein
MVGTSKTLTIQKEALAEELASLSDQYTAVMKQRRQVRRSDISALWRELGGRFGLRERQHSPSEVAEQIYQSWQTQNVLLIFNDVNCVPEASLQELLQNFWFPLVRKAALSQTLSNFKLLMFLVDYEGITDTWDMSFAERLDSIWEPHTPIQLPKLTNFSDHELINWIEDESDIFPPEFTNDVEQVVQEILANSNYGIPEFVLAEICRRCGLDWYEETDKWLKL